MESIGGPRASRSDRHESDAAMHGGVTCGRPWVNREAGCRQQRRLGRRWRGFGQARSTEVTTAAEARCRTKRGLSAPMSVYEVGRLKRIVRIIVAGFNRLVGAAGRQGVA